MATRQVTSPGLIKALDRLRTARTNLLRTSDKAPLGGGAGEGQELPDGGAKNKGGGAGEGQELPDGGAKNKCGGGTSDARKSGYRFSGSASRQNEYQPVGARPETDGGVKNKKRPGGAHNEAPHSRPVGAAQGGNTAQGGNRIE